MNDDDPLFKDIAQPAVDGSSGSHFDLAVKFLSNPKVFGLPDERKIQFLIKKGIERSVIERALEAVKFSSIPKASQQLQPKHAKRSGGGFFGFIWKLIKYSSGIAFGAYLLKRFLMPNFDDILGFRRRNVGSPNRHAASVRSLAGETDAEVTKKLDNIVRTLQEVVARQEAVSESLAALVASQKGGEFSADQPAEGQDRLLQELADLKAMMVAPNRFPPMPTSTYIPSNQSSSTPLSNSGSKKSAQHHGSKKKGSSSHGGQLDENSGPVESS